jgi:hypothetical protein
VTGFTCKVAIVPSPLSRLFLSSNDLYSAPLTNIFVLDGEDLVSRVDMQVGLHFGPSEAHLSEVLFATGWMFSCACVQAGPLCN